MTVSCISYACCAAPCGFMVHQRRAAKASWYVWQNDPNLTLWSVDYSCVWRLFLKSGIDHLWVQMFVYRSRRWWGFRAHRKMAPGTRDPTSQQSEQLRRAENNFKRLCSSQRTRVTCRLAQMYAWNFCLWQSLCVPQKKPRYLWMAAPTQAGTFSREYCPTQCIYWLGTWLWWTVSPKDLRFPFLALSASHFYGSQYLCIWCTATRTFPCHLPLARFSWVPIIMCVSTSHLIASIVDIAYTLSQLSNL